MFERNSAPQAICVCSKQSKKCVQRANRKESAADRPSPKQDGCQHLCHRQIELDQITQFTLELTIAWLGLSQVFKTDLYPYFSFSVSHIVYLFEPPHDKTSKIPCAPSEDLDQNGHPPSLISLCYPHEGNIGPLTTYMYWVHSEDWSN